jgi:DnaJ-class molecular chaperone
MRIDIPAGAEMGSKLRLVGVGPNGADFCLVILIRPHPVFVRRDLNVYVLYPVSETLAYYGGEMQVPVLEMNKSICFAIPANTKDRQIFRFANKGFPNVDEPAEFGDLYLVVALYDPRSMPQEFKELLEDINNYMR